MAAVHNAEDQIHTDITTYNIEELQQKYRLGTASNILLRCGYDYFYRIKTHALNFCSGEEHLIRTKVPNPS